MGQMIENCNRTILGPSQGASYNYPDSYRYKHSGKMIAMLYLEGFSRHIANLHNYTTSHLPVPLHDKYSFVSQRPRIDSAAMFVLQCFINCRVMITVSLSFWPASTKPQALNTKAQE